MIWIIERGSPGEPVVVNVKYHLYDTKKLAVGDGYQTFRRPTGVPQFELHPRLDGQEPGVTDTVVETDPASQDVTLEHAYRLSTRIGGIYCGEQHSRVRVYLGQADAVAQ